MLTLKSLNFLLLCLPETPALQGQLEIATWAIS